MSPIRRWAVTQLNQPDSEMSSYPRADLNSRILQNSRAARDIIEKPSERRAEGPSGRHSTRPLVVAEHAGTSDSEEEEMPWGTRQNGDGVQHEGVGWWRSQERLAAVEEDVIEEEWDEKIETDRPADRTQRWKFEEDDQEDFGTDDESFHTDQSGDSGLHRWRLRGKQAERAWNTEDAWTVRPNLREVDTPKIWEFNIYSPESDRSNGDWGVSSHRVGESADSDTEEAWGFSKCAPKSDSSFPSWNNPSTRKLFGSGDTRHDVWAACNEAEDDDATRQSSAADERGGGGGRGWRRELEEDKAADHRTEQQRRMDAWVSSVHTYCSSTSDSFDFPPLSFDDNFPRRRGLDGGEDSFDGFPLQDLECEEYEVQMYLDDKDKRFGFSVIGGYDEGIIPRVNEITLSSPADRAELEVGDEIVEVNGKSVEHCSHAEIIAHIHQCIRSKAVRLRVKRLKDGEKVPEVSKVHDAYIIAVEENARKKLEDVSVNHKVVPVDMTRSAAAHGEEGVTSFCAEPSETHKHLEPLLQQEDKEPELEEEIQLVEQNSVESLSMPVADKQRKSSSWRNSGGSINGSVEDMEMNGVMEKEAPRKGRGGKGKKERSVNKAHSNPDTLLIEELVGREKLSSNGKAASHTSLNHTSQDIILYDPESEIGFQHSGQNSFDYSDTGPHREMAIDCPDSFIGAVKTPPKYPPPPPPLQSSSSTAAPASVPRVPPTTPSKLSDSVRDRAKTDNVVSEAASVGGSLQPKPTMEQLERLRKHQEDLRKRREEESRQQQEQEFLRVSLRGSKKLQALENRRAASPDAQASPTGFVNTAYVDAEDDYGAADDVDRAPLSLVQPRERYLKKNAGIEDLLSTLHHVRNRLNTGDNTSSTPGGHDVGFLKTLFHNAQFQQAVVMHQKMVDITSRSPRPRPVRTDARELFMDVRSSSPSKSSEAAMKELIHLLSKPHMKNLLKAHDKVAERETQPILHSQETDLDSYPLLQHGEDSVKIIHLEKTNEHLGATVKNEGDSVIVARIVTGGAAEKSGLLHEGDEILEVNGIEMRGKNVNEVSEILANMSGTITFMIIPGHSCVEPPSVVSDTIMHLRAMFNYDPEEDPYIPCRELGISFLKGDILHAIQLSDPNWWQAHREGEEEQHSLAGLIPSRSFQEQRETVRRQLQAEIKENKKRSRVCACGRKERKKKKKKKALYSASVSEEAEEILTYEEVTRYYPQPNRKRPVVLIGPPDVGRQELRNRLMQWDCDRFAFAVPHTSRGPEPGEQPGKEYHFITRSMFEADILSGKFLEYGEYLNNLYGTSFEAVRQVISEGKQCILNLDPESLKVLRNTDLKPYAVFICPPNMEKLQQLHLDLGKHRPTDEKLKEIIEKGREMEEMYGHLFDAIIVNMDIERTFDELKQEIFRIDNEPQWVPSHWLDNSIM